MTLPDEFLDVLAGMVAVPDPATAPPVAAAEAPAEPDGWGGADAARPTGSDGGSGWGAAQAAASGPAAGGWGGPAGPGAGGAGADGRVPAPRRAPRLGPEATDLPPLDAPELPEFGAGSPPVPQRDLRLLAEVQVELAVELGRVKMPLRELLALGPGAVLELDRAADAPVDVLVNGCLVARGEVVVIDGDFGVRVTAVVER